MAAWIPMEASWEELRGEKEIQRFAITLLWSPGLLKQGHLNFAIFANYHPGSHVGLLGSPVSFVIHWYFFSMVGHYCPHNTTKFSSVYKTRLVILLPPCVLLSHENYILHLQSSMRQSWVTLTAHCYIPFKVWWQETSHWHQLKSTNMQIEHLPYVMPSLT